MCHNLLFCVPAPPAAAAAASGVTVIVVNIFAVGIVRVAYVVILILSPGRARGVQAQSVLHAQGHAAQRRHQVHRQRQLESRKRNDRDIST